ncbi:MAG: septum formation protein Maf [Alphaproteobacteria bacterium]|nr:septum formation protein Maf [Alphaproteobacteria bacterium]
MSSFILASASPQRKALLEQIGLIPDIIEPANIDETPKKGEKPSAYVKRMAIEKARFVADKYRGRVVLGSDTIIVVGSDIIQKSKNDEEQIKVMKKLSGKSHKVLSAVCVINEQGKSSVRLNTTKILMKKLSDKEIIDYVSKKEWIGCAGYKIEGCLAGYVRKIIGSYSGVVGLPLFEARNLLNGAGIR